jgi:hypothetical protein
MMLVYLFTMSCIKSRPPLCLEEVSALVRK